MKRIFCLVLISMAACSTKDASHLSIPTFHTNGSLDDVWEPIKNVAAQMDFAIAYSEGGGPLTEQGELVHKMFCLDNGVWQLIEIRRGIVDVDSIKNGVNRIERDTTLKRTCENEESQALLDSLISLGIFSLPDQTELIKKCEEQDRKMTITHDAQSITFYLIRGNDVRILTFYDLEQKIADCPNVSEMESLRRIKALFGQEWFSSRHF